MQCSTVYANQNKREADFLKTLMKRQVRHAKEKRRNGGGSNIQGAQDKFV